MSPFSVLKEKKRGIVGRLLGRRVKEDAAIRINNLLAAADDPLSISAEEIKNVFQEFRLKQGKDLAGDLLAFYSRYLDESLSSMKLTPDTVKRLEHLGTIFQIQTSDAKDAFEKAVGPIYLKAVQEAVSDGFLTATEKADLERVRMDLGVPKELAESIYADCAASAYRGFFDLAAADGKLSPDEETRLVEIAESLRLNVKHDEDSAAAMASFLNYLGN